MLLGRVMGTVVSTAKDRELEGLKLLLVQAVDEKCQPRSGAVVCVDAVGAGVGEIVMYASGSSARQTEVTKNRPVDHVIMAIVDEIASEGEVLWSKTYPTTP